MARKTKQQARETRQHILDVALRLFSQQGVSSTSLAAIAKAAGVTRGLSTGISRISQIYSVKSGSFQTPALAISKLSIGQNSPTIHSQFQRNISYILEATVTEERRRLMMEIIFHKCEFVGEMAVVQQAQRSSVWRATTVSSRLKECIAAKLLPANLFTRRAAILMRSYLSGLMENWLLPRSFDLEKEARLRRDSAGDVSVLPDAARPPEVTLISEPDAREF
jgi:TetR/AcrR family acrAB operon transcriptional repressor